MKAIVSVFARDARGIIAYIATLLAEQDINVLGHQPDADAGVLHHDHAGGPDGVPHVF